MTSSGQVQSGMANFEAQVKIVDGHVVNQVGRDVVNASGQDVNAFTKQEANTYVDENGQVITQATHTQHYDQFGNILHNPNVQLASLTAAGATTKQLKGLSGAELARLQEKAQAAIKSAKADPSTAAKADDAIKLAEEAFAAQGVPVHLH
jgi:hypothetical protein